MEHIAQRIQTLRLERGYTQQELADLCETSLNQIRRYETGQFLPSAEGLMKLSKGLHISVDSLLFEDYEAAPDERLAQYYAALEKLTPQQKEMVLTVFEALVLKFEKEN